jgi:hypothetical protein
MNEGYIYYILLNRFRDKYHKTYFLGPLFGVPDRRQLKPLLSHEKKNRQKTSISSTY